MYPKYILYFALVANFFIKFLFMKKFFAFLTFFLVLFGLFGFFHIKSRFEAVSQNKEIILLELPKGSSLKNVSKILHQNNVWNDSDIFNLHCRLKKCALKAGWYEIPPHISLEELVALLSSGKNAVRKVTIPEGRASWEIPNYLQKAFPKIDSAKWNALVHDKNFANKLGVTIGNLEGYLLPDTYPFPVNATEEDILKQMVQANLKLKKEMEEKNSPMWKKLGGWHQILTLASVVEEETGKPDERPLIAGIFHNRLDIGMPLGADPTVRFIFKNLTGPIYKSQLQSDNPYNTRKFKGLMPGPISNPGRKAIEATLYPNKTNKLYFVAKDDGSGTHFFSATLAEHNNYKNIAAKNRGEN